jgi:hypothetical protein
MKNKKKNQCNVEVLNSNGINIIVEAYLMLLALCVIPKSLDFLLNV